MCLRPQYCPPTSLSPSSKPKYAAFGPNIEEFSFSLCSGTKIRGSVSPFHLWSISVRVFFFFFLMELTWICGTWPIFTPFRILPFAVVFLEFRFNPAQVHPHLQWRARSFFTRLNEIHFDVTFERIASGRGSREEVSSLLHHWSKPTPAHLSFSDGRYLWPWAAIGCGERPPSPFLLPHFTYPSSVLLSVSPGGLIFLSLSIILHCLRLLIYHPNGVSCHFKARSHSPCGQCRLSPLMFTCVAHLSKVQCPLSLSDADKFDSCPFSALQGWLVKVSVWIPLKMF